MSYYEPKVRVLSPPPSVQISVEVYRALKRFFEKSTDERLVYLHGTVDNAKKAVAVTDISIPPQLSAGASVEPDYDAENWLDWDLAFMAKCRQFPCVGIAHSFTGGGHHSDRDSNTDSLLGEEAKDANRTVMVSLTAKAGAWNSGSSDQIRCDVVWSPLNVGTFQAAWDDVHWYFYGDEERVAKMIEGSEERVKTRTYSHEGDARPLPQGSETDSTKKHESISLNTSPYEHAVEGIEDVVHLMTGFTTFVGMEWSVVRERESLRIKAVKYWNYDQKRYEIIDVTTRNRYIVEGDTRKMIFDTILWRYEPNHGLICGSDAKLGFHFLGRGHIQTVTAPIETSVYNKEKLAFDFLTDQGTSWQKLSWDSDLQIWSYGRIIPISGKTEEEPKKKTTKAEKKAAKKAEKKLKRTSTETVQDVLDDISFSKDELEQFKELTAYIHKYEMDQTKEALSEIYKTRQFRFESVGEIAAKATDKSLGMVIYHEEMGKALRRIWPSNHVTNDFPMEITRWIKVQNLGLSMCVGKVNDNQSYIYVLMPDTGDIIEIDMDDAIDFSELVTANYLATTLSAVFSPSSEEASSASPPVTTEQTVADEIHEAFDVPKGTDSTFRNEGDD